MIVQVEDHAHSFSLYIILNQSYARDLRVRLVVSSLKISLV